MDDSLLLLLLPLKVTGNEGVLNGFSLEMVLEPTKIGVETVDPLLELANLTPYVRVADEIVGTDATVAPSGTPEKTLSLRVFLS